MVRHNLVYMSFISFSTLLFVNCGGFKASKSSPDGFFNSSSMNPSLMCKAGEVEHATIRRLSNIELSNTLKDLLGINEDVTSEFPPDYTSGEGFTNNADALKMNPEYPLKLMPAVESALQKALAANSSIFQCAGAKDDACAKSLIRAFALKAFRRTPSPTEIGSMTDIFTSQKEDGASFEESLSAAYERALLSPYFLFRTSFDGTSVGEGIVSTSQFELVTKLAYFLWNSTPDQRLLDLASQSGINSEAVLRSEIQRMLQDPKAQRFAELFVGQWLGVDRVLASVLVGRDGLTDEMRKDMVTESRLFTSHVLRENKSIQDLIVGEYTFVNERLAQHYGLSGVTGSEFRKVDLKGSGRRGLLTQAAFLTLQASPNYTVPTSRGNKILNLVVCAPPPPFDFGEEVTPLAPETGNLTIRQRMEIHRAKPECAGCHRDMDPIGLALEGFDHLGKMRTTYNDGSKIETDGNFRGNPFKDSSELINLINSQNDYKRCISKNFMAYAIGRSTTGNDTCVLNQIGQLAVQPNKTFTDLVMAIVMSDQFRLNNLNK